MSDSLNETVIVSEPVLTISANGEDEDEDEDDELPVPEPPRLPAVVLAPLPPVVDDELEDELELDASAVEPPVTESPGSELESEAIVPVIGAYSLVSDTACSALRTLASAPYTAAWAEAMLEGEGVEVVLVWLEALEPLELEPVELEPRSVEPPLRDGVVSVELGALEPDPELIVVIVVIVVVVPDEVFCFALAGLRVVSETNSAEPDPPV